MGWATRTVTRLVRHDVMVSVPKVRCGSIATEMGSPPHVCFPPDSDPTADIAGGPVRANRRHQPCVRLISQ
jgi:hypothetical protein